MKKGVGAVAVVLLLAAALYLFFNLKNPAIGTLASPDRKPSASQNGTSPASRAASTATAAADSNSPATVSPPDQAQPGSLAAKAGQALPDSSPVADLPPATVLQNVRRAIHQYGDMFGGNPVGTNPEITSQLNGNNPRHANFIDAQAGMRINDQGELVDAWGTPFFFHQISGEETEVHSAGPDKIMWTADDLVVK
jgi:hypothetical protein